MDDREIIALMNARDENALAEIRAKYAGLLKRISSNILPDPGDAEEAVADALLNLWNAIPPAAPDNLRAYICRTVRNASVRKLRHDLAAKRSGDSLPLSELEDALGDDKAADEIGRVELGMTIDGFLKGLSREQRAMFLKRYFFFDSVPEIARDMGMKEEKVKSALFRLKKKLREYIARSENYDK